MTPAVAAASLIGADLGEWDWRAALPSWDWHGISLKGYPGWDRAYHVYRRGAVVPADYPPTVMFSTNKGKQASSRDLAVTFDDMARGAFYYRDWTESGLPFVDGGEMYRSRFWFQRTGDLGRFMRLLGTGRVCEPKVDADE